MPEKKINDIMNTLGRIESKQDQHTSDISDIRTKQEDLHTELTKYKGFFSGIKYVLGGLVFVGGFIIKNFFNKI